MPVLLPSIWMLLAVVLEVLHECTKIRVGSETLLLPRKGELTGFAS